MAGSSLLAAEILASGKHQVVMNWLGGLHHARKFKATGFCYINDIVVGIMRLLVDFKKVLYIDIDVHHGDGVQEAFYTTNRVLTLSLHHFAVNFFPGTGAVKEKGSGSGFGTSLNIPLKACCSDDSFMTAFKAVLDDTIEHYRPDAIYCQCGADSLIGDMIGTFNVSIKGHGFAVQHVLSKGLPTIFSGGGGYTPDNVAKCWAYETSLALKMDLPEQIPEGLTYYNEYTNKEVFHVPKNIHHPYKKDENSSAYIHSLIKTNKEILREYINNPAIDLPDLPTTKNYLSFETSSDSEPEKHYIIN